MSNQRGGDETPSAGNVFPMSLSLQSVVETPITQQASSSVSLRTWFKEVTDSPCCLSTLIGVSQYRHLMSNVLFFLRKIGSLTQGVVKFFKRVLERLLQKEANHESLLENKTFVKTLLACCFETYYFVHDLTSISFEEVLGLFKIEAFEFWKQINNFAKFQPRIPEPLLQYLKELENKVLACLVWKDSESLMVTLHSPTFALFSRRLLALVAQRIVILCQAIGLNANVQEEVWEAMKHFLSEYIEQMKNRTIDQLLICMVFGVCKVKCEIPFKNIIQKYHQIFHCYRDRYEDLNEFYNTCVISLMKEYLLGETEEKKPRISDLNPKSPLRAGNPGSAHSPYLTPRTRRLWDYGVDSKHASRKLVFDKYETKK